MNIPKIILNDRKIISSEVYHYYQSLAQRLIMKKRNSQVNIASNYSREKIQNWFSNLNIMQKFKVCSIYNNWFSNIIFQMMEYSHFESVIEFFPTDVYQEFKKYNVDEYSYLKNELNETKINTKTYDNFITFFTGDNKVKQLSGVPDDFELININNKFHMENLFLASLRFITLDTFNDTISFNKDLFNHTERLFEFFNYFSKNQCFRDIVTPIQEKNNNYNFSFPNWIYKYESYSFCQLLLIFFEQVISVYYQIYLYEQEIPQFNIDQKFNEFFKTNENLKNYLLKKNKNDSEDFIIDKKKYFDLINSEPMQDKILYYENKSKFVYSLAFGLSLYEQNLNTKREFSLKFYYLMELAKKNSNEFIDKISFIESKDSFKYLNFIYSVIYQLLIEQCSVECYQELLTEEKNKSQNETISTKSKKNKKKRKKKKKAEKENKETKIVNNNIENSKEEEEDEKTKNIIDNNEEEIEEIPADYIIHPKTEQSLKDFELNNNNIINNNDINNSTVSSSYTNKYSKDYNTNPLGPRYNNFFKCEKKESEMLLEIKDFSDDVAEENNEEKEKNNNIELEDISENDISEENININEIKIDLSENKKKKKKNKKRNKKKKNKYTNENINDDINKNISNNVNETKENNIIINDTNKQNDSSIISRDKDNIENQLIKKEQGKIEDKSNDNKIILQTQEEKKNKTFPEKSKSEEIQKEENGKHKRKKEFFLFPVNNNKKKEKNNLNNISVKNEKINSDKIIDIKKESNISLNNNITKTEIINNNHNNKIFKKDNNQISKKEEKSENIKLNPFKINKVSNITINSDKKELKKTKESGDNFDKDKNYFKELKNENNLLYLNQPTNQNPLFYVNCNNSYLVFQNEMFTILGKDVLKFQKHVENNLKEINKYREQTIDIFKDFITKILMKDYFTKFLFYGSYSTGLSIESSDIDILIKFNKKNKNKEAEINSQKNISDLIFLLNEEFIKNKDKLKIVKTNPIYTASIPVLKIECLLKDLIPIDIQTKLSKNYLFPFENELLKLHFDFTFLEVDDINKEQIIPSKEIIHFIKESIKIYPIIKPIILVLKRYMQINKLNSSYQGGISSFSLFLLLASYNKQIFYENKYLAKNKDFENLIGQILYGFFMFYANFNFKINSIDLKNEIPINLLNELNENKITIIDPITGLNAAKSTFKIEQIQLAFNNAILVINDIFFRNYNCIDDNEDEENNIIIKLFSTNNLNNYLY